MHFHGLWDRVTAMTSFSLHFRMANSNTITHFVEPILCFFANWRSDRRKWRGIHSYRNSRRADAVTRVGHTFVLLGLVQPILPCGSKLLYWFLWVTSRPWRHAQSLYGIIINTMHVWGLGTRLKRWARIALSVPLVIRTYHIAYALLIPCGKKSIN